MEQHDGSDEHSCQHGEPREVAVGSRRGKSRARSLQSPDGYRQMKRGHDPDRKCRLERWIIGPDAKTGGIHVVPLSVRPVRLRDRNQ